MSFTSIEFIVFFTVLFLLYYLVLQNNTKLQNVLLLVASYFFYGWADWKILPILIIATLAFYYIGSGIQNAKDKGDEKLAKILRTSGVILGIGVLFYFKYFNFFILQFGELLDGVGLKTNWHAFKIILPIGISFFTFKLISYVIEVNRGVINASSDMVSFATYIAFFPTLLSGPIDRPNEFLPQLQKRRFFDYTTAVDGSRQVLWGAFKKMVVADNCAIIIDGVWNDISGVPGSSLAIVAILYSIQIYADFSGYSDMAIGVGKIFGFRITDNFRYPYFSRNMQEFWRRWHISLTSWLTDYIYFPLGGSRVGYARHLINLMAVFLICGLWHGANWTFVVWGGYNGLLLCALIVCKSNNHTGTVAKGKNIPSFKEFIQILITFFLATLGWIIFRAETLGQAKDFISAMFSWTMVSIPYGLKLGKTGSPILFFLALIFLFSVEWKQRNNEHGLSFDNAKSIYFKLFMCYLVGIWILLLNSVQNTFIYFAF